MTRGSDLIVGGARGAASPHGESRACRGVEPGGGFLVDDQAVAACVLWGSGVFDTADIARLLGVREDAVCRTLHMARDAARMAGER